MNKKALIGACCALGVVILASGLVLVGEDAPNPELVALRAENAELRERLDSKITEDRVREIVMAALPEQQQRAITVNGDVSGLLKALREEADMLMEYPKLHTSNVGNVYVNAQGAVGYAMSRVYNRLVNGCEYELYNYGEDKNGLKYKIRRLESDCAD